MHFGEHKNHINNEIPYLVFFLILIIRTLFIHIHDVPFSPWCPFLREVHRGQYNSTRQTKTLHATT